jgi:hypothetical protein
LGFGGKFVGAELLPHPEFSAAVNTNTAVNRIATRRPSCAERPSSPAAAAGETLNPEVT